MELFTQNNDNCSSEKIISKIKKGEWQDILQGLCNINNDSINLNYTYFKYLASKETYVIILNYITTNIDSILSNYDSFKVYVNLKHFTLIDVDKHRQFIQNMSTLLKDKYPKRLTKCYLYNAPGVFSQMFNIISLFIDKETQSKIELVTTK